MEDLDMFLGGWGRDGTISTASSSLVEFHILDSLATFPATIPPTRSLQLNVSLLTQPHVDHLPPRWSTELDIEECRATK